MKHFFFLIILIAVVFTACGGQDKLISSSSAQASQEPTKEEGRAVEFQKDEVEIYPLDGEGHDLGGN